MPKLHTIDGRFEISESYFLTNIDLPQLQTVEGYVEIFTNPRLTSISMPQLQTIGVGLENESLRIFDNVSLTSINLSQLQTIEGYVDIYSNQALIDCDLGSYTNLCP